MSKQPTTGFEHERLHRAMMQAHARTGALERRLQDERRRQGIEPLVEMWLDAAVAIRAQVARKRADLLRDGNAAAHLDRVEQRLAGLVGQSQEFVLATDLETGSASWQLLAYEVSSLSGPNRDALLRFVVSRKEEIDDALEGLARVRAGRNVDPEQAHRTRELQEERRRAARSYDTLREEYLAAPQASAGVPPPANLAFAGESARFDLPLRHLLRESRFERLASPDLRRLVDVDRHLGGVVTGRIDKTLAGLSTGGRHTLTDPRVTEFRRHIAGLDGAFARLKDAPAEDRLVERRELGVLLRRIGDLAGAPDAARHLEPFRRLVEERRAQVARIAGGPRTAAGGEVPHERGALQLASPAGEAQLQRLRRLHPGLGKLLREVPDSPIAAAVRRRYDLTPLERLRPLLPWLERGAPGPVAAARPGRPAHFEAIKRLQRDEEPPEPEVSAEPSVPSRPEPHPVEPPRVVPAVVPAAAREEPKRELLVIPPLPSPQPEPDEEPAVAELPQALPHPPVHALANIAHLRAMAARLRHELQPEREEDAPPPLPPVPEMVEEAPAVRKLPAPALPLLPHLPLVPHPPLVPHLPLVSHLPPAPAPPFVSSLPRLPALPLEVLSGRKPFHPPVAAPEEQIERRPPVEAVPAHVALPEDPLVEAFRDADDSRIFVERAAHRGDVDHGDDSDPDAVDTWVGAGEGAKLFSDVFAAFLPAEAGPQVVHSEGKQKKAEPSGFFAKLVDKVEDFAGRAVQRALQAGGRFVAEAQQSEKIRGGGGLEGLGRAVAGQLHGAAAMAEGFLRGVHLDSAAALAHHVASATDAKSQRGERSLDEPRRLEASTLNRMEGFLQGDFRGVRVHTGEGAAEITDRYGAEAVTVTDHIFFAPGKFNPGTLEGEKLIAHELTHVLQKGRQNLDVRTAESEALRAERSYGKAPAMETLDLRRPAPDFKFAEVSDGDGAGLAHGVHSAKRTRSRRDDAGGKDELPDGDEFLEKVSGRVYELLMEELEESFESR